MRARWPHADPIQPACGTPARPATPRLLPSTVECGFFEESGAHAAVGVYPAVAQERPTAAHFFDAGRVDVGIEDGLLVGGSFRDDHAERVCDERRPPEFDTIPRSARGVLVSHTVGCRDVYAVGDRVAALDGAPCVALLRAVRAFFLRVPADRRGIEQDGRALERSEPGALRVPLVPAHQRADAARGRIERAEAQ